VVKPSKLTGASNVVEVALIRRGSTNTESGTNMYLPTNPPTISGDYWIVKCCQCFRQMTCPINSTERVCQKCIKGARGHYTTGGDIHNHQNRRVADNRYFHKHQELKGKHCDWCECQSNLTFHHTRYDKPRVGVWLCQECHRAYHEGWSAQRIKEIQGNDAGIQHIINNPRF